MVLEDDQVQIAGQFASLKLLPDSDAHEAVLDNQHDHIGHEPANNASGF